MTERKEPQNDDLAAQQEMVAKARSLPGVAEVVEVFGPLSIYTQLVNVQPSQVRNATEGNLS